MNNIQHKGEWWIPENPDKKISGFLTFSQESGGKLNLIGSFKDIEGRSAVENDSYPVVLGVTTDGKYITLQSSFETNYSFTTAMTQETSLYVNYIYVGIHLPEESYFSFNKIQAKFTYLYDWVGVSGISRESLGGGSGFQMSYTPPEDITIRTENGKIDITFGANIKSNYDISSINEQASIFIESNNEISFSEISQNYLFPIRSLINLGTTKANFIEELYFFLAEYPTNPIAVYYAQKFYKPKSKDYLLPLDMLFTLGDIYEDLENRINNWISISQEISSVLHLLDRVRISSDMFLELKFLSIAQAVETYHRTRKNNNFLPADEHKTRVEEILGYIPEKYKELVKRKIDQNEKSLLVRFDELAAEKADIMLPIVHDIEKFNKKARDSRNYYTHYGKKKKKSSAHGIQLHWIMEKLSVLLQTCLLDEIGIAPEKQMELFSRNQRYNFLQDLKNQ